MFKERGKILIVDDHHLNARALQRILQGQYQLELAHSGTEGLEQVRSFEPDLVLLDIMMPDIDGYEICQRIKSGPCGQFTQVVFVSGKASTPERLRGYRAGADDYIVKPFDHDELYSRVEIQFRLRESQQRVWELSGELQRYNTQLEEMVANRTADVVAAQEITIFSLARLADSRDPETGEHLLRMRAYAQLLAQELSRRGPYTEQVDSEFLRNLYRSSPLHDIGKVGIPDSILLKPGKLTSQEFELMKQHVLIGAETLEAAADFSQGGAFLQMAVEIARYHHERWDGTGYCLGLREEQIPLSARIVAVADVYDALTSQRVYKEAMPAATARQIIRESSGSHFGPVVVEAFESQFAGFLSVTHDSPKRHSPREMRLDRVR